MMPTDHDCTDKLAAHHRGQRRLEFTPTAAMQAGIRQTKGQRILARLRQGPATTMDLARITVAFSQRLGDLKRELGIEVHREDHIGPDLEYSLYVLTKDAEGR